jgi:hypothetical protein
MRHWAGQALRLAQSMPMGQHRTLESRVFFAEESIERSNGRQSSIDGGGLEPSFGLLNNELVYISKGDGVGGPVADHFDKLFEVVTIIAPRSGTCIPAALPVDEACYFD